MSGLRETAAALRTAVLDAWAASPARFREDANAEDDLALGGYRDRLVVELAQNASDVGPGTLRLRFADGVLEAANTGFPLTAAGLTALSTLRASSKRSGRTVGRFGVGFAAVAAVADEVVVASTSGSVRFSRAATLEAVRALPSLAAELAAREDRVPLLRLPFPCDEVVPEGFDTAIRVMVRPSAYPLVQAMLDDLDPVLLLVLPGLEQVDLDGRRIAATHDGDDVLLDGRRWRIARGSGDLDPALLAGRPVEERAADRWEVVWAVPVDEDGEPIGVEDGVVRAPTPTDDPLSFPAVLAASLPLGPDRRRVQEGALRDEVLARAADVLVGLLPRLADSPARLLFVPGPFAKGEVDAALGACVMAALRDAPFLAAGRRPRDAVVLDGASGPLVTHLVDVLPGLLPAGWSAHRWSAPLRALDVRRLDLAGLTEVLAGMEREPSWWRALYDLLPPDRDQLGSLPVPLADGRLAPSPVGLLLGANLTALGLRTVHPDAAHPLLVRLGAVEPEPRALLEDPRVRAAVEAAIEEDDPQPIVDAVLALVGEAGIQPGELAWLSALPLPDSDGDWVPAGELLLPGGPLARVVDLEAGFGVVQQGVAHDDVLAAVGVLRGFAVVPVEDAEDVDGLDPWLESLAPGEEADAVVRDLDLVVDWPGALALLASQDLLRLPYVRWWLAAHPVAAGQRPRDLRLPGSDPLLEGLYDEAPAGLAVGVRAALAEVLADDVAGLIERLADPTRVLTREQVRTIHARLAVADPEVEPPASVRAVVDGRLEVVLADDAVVVDRPDLLARVTPYAVVPVPLHLAAALAEVLDLALASEVVPDADLSGPDDNGDVVEHDLLQVLDAGGEAVDVDWARVGRIDHVVGAAGRARALAWRDGDWGSRHARELALRGLAHDAETDLDEA